VSPRALDLSDKRWAQRAHQLQFHELDAVRATAERWRTGLAALTSLLAASSVIAAPGLADRLPGGWHVAVGIIALAGLLSLLYGTWEAMTAAFGRPGAAVTMTGERLHRWESAQAQTGVAALRRARFATAAGILLLILTAGTTFLGASTAAGQTARVDLGGVAYCGRIEKGTTDGKITVTGRDGTVRTVSLAEVKSLDPAAAC
jgi:hypothetical protein